MTGSAPVLDRPALRAALSHMQIELPGSATRFEEALAEQQAWPLRFATRVTDEYRRFLYLAATAGFEVTPSKAVDEAWHLHLTLPHYREMLVGQILGRPLDHRPGTGEPEDDERCRRQYEETLALYERTFGKPPPGDIWPRPIPEGGEEEWTAAMEKRRKICRGFAVAGLIGSLVTLGSGNFVVGILLLAGATVLFLFAEKAFGATRRDGSSGCGSSCGGGSSGSSDDCGASCGGSSCGGGGCGGGD